MIAGVTGKSLVLCALCACGPSPVSDPDAAITPPDPDLEQLGAPEQVKLDVDPVSGCSTFGTQTYSPYRRPGGYPHDTVANVPWRGEGAMYPNGMEDFSNYGALPATVECGDDKALRSYVDVTAGCLTAIQLGTYTRGKITTTSDGYYRSIALGYKDGSDLPAKWTDQSRSTPTMSVRCCVDQRW